MNVSYISPPSKCGPSWPRINSTSSRFASQQLVAKLPQRFASIQFVNSQRVCTWFHIVHVPQGYGSNSSSLLLCHTWSMLSHPHNFFVGVSNFLSLYIVFITVGEPPIMPPKFELTSGVPALHIYDHVCQEFLCYILQKGQKILCFALLFADPCWKMALVIKCAGMSHKSLIMSMRWAAWTRYEVLLIEAVAKKGTICGKLNIPNTLHYVP